jgi:protease I
MAKILIIISPENFRDEELKIPMQIFKQTGNEFTIASTTAEMCQGMLGYEIKPDKTVSDVKVGDYDAIVVVGGSGSPALAEKPEVLKLLKSAQLNNKIVGAICMAPVVLARAGVLSGKRATVYQTPESLKVLQAAGSLFTNEPVVVDGKIVTANGPQAAAEFAKAILELL